MEGGAQCGGWSLWNYGGGHGRLPGEGDLSKDLKEEKERDEQVPGTEPCGRWSPARAKALSAARLVRFMLRAVLQSRLLGPVSGLLSQNP